MVEERGETLSSSKTSQYNDALPVLVKRKRGHYDAE